jgi:hypothetical protein
VKVLLVTFLLLFWSIGCDSSGSCRCPLGGAQITLDPALQRMIVKVTTDTCSLATDDPTQGVFLSATKTTTCHVELTLANGETLSSTVTFASVGGCCSDIYYGADGSVPVVVDGGSP